MRLRAPVDQEVYAHVMEPPRQLSLWPVHPQPHEDELLSSWIIRIAHGNGYKVQPFCQGFFGKETQIWTLDIDRSAEEGLLNVLAQKTGVPVERVRQLTLQSWDGVVAERVFGTICADWVMPLGIRGRSHTAPGLMFCSSCLRDDVEPYLRCSWRLAWSTTCAVHRCALHDRCPKCSSLFQPHKADHGYRSHLATGTTIATCSHCRFDLRLASAPRTAADEDLARQIAFQNVVLHGVSDIPGISGSHALAFFAGIRAMVHLHLRVRDIPGLRDIRSGMRAERLSVAHRTLLLRRVWEDLDDWPNKFVTCMAKINRAVVLLRRDRPSLPWWLQKVCDEYLRHAAPKITNDEAAFIEHLVIKREGKFSVGAARRLTGRYLQGHEVARRSRATPDEVQQLIAALDQKISASGGDLRRDLLRDKVMLLTGRVLGLGLCQLAKLRVDDPRVAPGDDWYETPWALPETAEQLRSRWMPWYVPKVRSAYSPAPVSPWLFLHGRAAAPLSKSLVSLRFSRAVAQAGLHSRFKSYADWIHVD